MMNESIWTATQRTLSFPALEGDTKTDVLIIGGGLTGLLTAYFLEQAGVDCLLLEAGSICGGISGNTTAKITSQHGLIYHRLTRMFGSDAARLYWEAHENAIRQFHSLCRTIDCDFERRASCVYSVDRPEILEQELTAMERAGIPAEYVAQPALPISTVGAVRMKHQAQFHPLKFAAAIAKGRNIREHTRVLAFHGSTVLTDHGTVTAQKIIVATHFPLLNKHGWYFVKMYQERSYVLALEGAVKTEDMYVDEAEAGLSFRSYQDYLLLGGGGHRAGKQGGGWEMLENVARAYYPNARVAYRWAAQDCMTLDGIPYIGRYGKHTPELYVATGFNKWGMTSAMVSALVLRDRMLGKENPYAALFSPDRTILRRQLPLNLMESAVHILKPTAPRCPHMGCALEWNPQEHSWDCPCHGSRFAEDGRLLDNPATGDLHFRRQDRPD